MERRPHPSERRPEDRFDSADGRTDAAMPDGDDPDPEPGAGTGGVGDDRRWSGDA